MATAAGQWAIVVPVKRLVEAKTRLIVPPDVRMELALAMALDTVTAAVECLATDIVVAVCDDDRAVPELRRLGATVVADEPDAGLNPALVHGARAAGVPADHPVAALSADLPALRATDLADVLAAAAAHIAVGRATSFVVADANGTGTTLLAAATREHLRPAFGAQSRAAHITAGAVDLTDAAGASLRRDVDTLADLRHAAALGLGGATRGVLDRHRAVLEASS